jgi:8-oxo-dGTP pyrophosphatase MutT (NUDIX family)
MFTPFIHSLEQRLQQTLPGAEAQFKMASQFRLPIDMEQFDLSKARKGAVLILLYPHGDKINTVLTLRPSYDGVHSGQVSFPGGKLDPEDESLAAAALREAEEEVGLNRNEVTLIGNLTDLYIPPSNFLVSPFVGIMDKKPVLTKNEREVEKIIEVPITYFLDESIKGKKMITPREFVSFEAPYYDVEGHTVWGATAMMLSEMMEVIRQL